MIGNERSLRTEPRTVITEEILESLRTGDHEAFKKVFIRYYNKLEHFIGALIKSPADAEELTQEIFTNLWHKRQQIDPAKNFNSYLYTQARNTALNFIRAKAVRHAYAVEAWTFDQTAEDTEEIIFAKETELLIRITVSRMPSQRRNIYEMSRNRGLTNEEIATELGISRNAVEKQLRLALNDIREIVTLFAIILYL